MRIIALFEESGKHISLESLHDISSLQSKEREILGLKLDEAKNVLESSEKINEILSYTTRLRPSRLKQNHKTLGQHMRLFDDWTDDQIILLCQLKVPDIIDIVRSEGVRRGLKQRTQWESPPWDKQTAEKIRKHTGVLYRNIDTCNDHINVSALEAVASSFADQG